MVFASLEFSNSTIIYTFVFGYNTVVWLTWFLLSISATVLMRGCLFVLRFYDPVKKRGCGMAIILHTLFDLITALCTQVFQNYLENLWLNIYVPTYSTSTLKKK